jgi:preprotein translocase subunit SecD
MSDYIERLRGELLRAEAAKQRRVRVPSLRPVLVAAGVVAVLAAVVVLMPGRPDSEVTATGTTTIYRVDGDAEGVARVLRERLPGAAVTVSGQTLTITASFDVAPFLKPGRLAVYDAERNLRDRPALDNAAVASAAPSTDPITREPVVLLALTADGQERFLALTRALAHRGEDVGEFQHFAITIDDEVYSEPYIDWRYAPNGIDGADGLHISGGFTAQQARELAAVLDSGPLPGTVTQG